MRLHRRAVLAAAVLAALVVAAGCTDHPVASPVVEVAGVEPRVGREVVLEHASTTTTTTAPPTTTTTAPPAPPPAPKIQAVRRAPAPPPPPAPAPPAPNASDEARALQLLNGERSKAGLAPLQLSGGIRSVARSWSTHMAGSGLAHNPDVSGDLRRAGVSGWSTAGENVGYGRSVDSVHGMFMGSPAHRDNILSSAFTHVGIGVVHAGGKVWVTMDFVGY